jgi:hypothetical protein
MRRPPNRCLSSDIRHEQYWERDECNQDLHQQNLDGVKNNVQTPKHTKKEVLSSYHSAVYCDFYQDGIQCISKSKWKKNKHTRENERKYAPTTCDFAIGTVHYVVFQQ